MMERFKFSSFENIHQPDIVVENDLGIIDKEVKFQSQVIEPFIERRGENFHGVNIKVTLE